MRKTIKVNNDNIKKIVKEEIEKYGLEADLNHIDTSETTNLNRLFLFSKFNGDISKWNVSKVENMFEMFAYSNFNGDISKWNISKVENMTGLFTRSDFNRDISNLDVSNVKKTDKIFLQCNIKKEFKPRFKFFATDYNLRSIVIKEIEEYGLNADLNNIDVSDVYDMSKVFMNLDFNGDISKWDVSNVKYMVSMFEGSKFNGDISKWDVSMVENMSDMFSRSKFNGDISRWNVSRVENMSYMFDGSIFNGDISRWNICNITDMKAMFRNSKDLSKLRFPETYYLIDKFIDLRECFANTNITGLCMDYFLDIDRYNDNYIKDCFLNCKELNQEIYNNGYKLYVRNDSIEKTVERVVGLFGYKCNLNIIDVSRVSDFSNLFRYYNDVSIVLGYFNGDISEWDVSNGHNMSCMFYRSKFNGDLSKWNFKSLFNANSMFYNCKLKLTQELEENIDKPLEENIRWRKERENRCTRSRSVDTEYPNWRGDVLSHYEMQKEYDRITANRRRLGLCD